MATARTQDEIDRMKDAPEKPDAELESYKQLRRDAERTITFTPIGEKEEIKLSPSMAYRYFAQATAKGHKPSENQVMEFLMLCRSAKLNPWVKDAYLLGYDTKDGPQFNIITAYQAMSKRAELHPEYDGLDYGIIVALPDGSTEEREGTFRLPHEALVGAWCKVHRKDRGRPFVVKLPRGPYDKGYSYWKVNPDWMLAKCAKAGAMREAFPLELGGLYIEEELPRADELRVPPEPSVRPQAPRQKVTAADLTRQPEPAEKPVKAASELQLELRRCSSVDDVNAVRDSRSKNTNDIDEFDLLNLACDKRIAEILGHAGVKGVPADSPGEVPVDA